MVSSQTNGISRRLLSSVDVDPFGRLVSSRGCRLTRLPTALSTLLRSAVGDVVSHSHSHVIIRPLTWGALFIPS